MQYTLVLIGLDVMRLDFCLTRVLGKIFFSIKAFARSSV